MPKDLSEKALKIMVCPSCIARIGINLKNGVYECSQCAWQKKFE